MSVCLCGRFFTAAHNGIVGSGCHQFRACFCSSSLALCLCGSHAPACKMHRRHPFGSWRRFQRTAHRTALPPKGKVLLEMWTAGKSLQTLTSLAWVMSTAHACKSHLLPTSTIGTSSASFTRFICSRYVPERIFLLIISCCWKYWEQVSSPRSLWQNYFSITHQYPRNFWHYLQRKPTEILRRCAYTAER